MKSAVTTSTTRKSRSKSAAASHTNPESFIAHIDRSEHIAVSAYYKAQARGFTPGGELEDWLQAEAEFASKSVGM